jgi:hypothetical protein
MAVGIHCADHATPSILKKLILTSPTSSGRSVGIVRSRSIHVASLPRKFPSRSVCGKAMSLCVPGASLTTRPQVINLRRILWLPWLLSVCSQAPRFMACMLSNITVCSIVVKALCYKPEGHGFDTR